MAFKLRVGALNLPDPGDTIYVYETGTTTLVEPIFSPDSSSATLTNPFTVPSSGWYGFEPPNNNRVDVYWEEKDEYILIDANVKDNFSRGTGLAGQVLTSQGPNMPTIWKSREDVSAQTKSDLLNLQSVSIGQKIYVVDEETTYVVTSTDTPLDYSNFSIDSYSGAIDMPGCVIGDIPPDQNIFVFVCGRDTYFEENMPDSIIRCVNPPDVDYTFYIYKNGTKVGDVIFYAGTTEAQIISSPFNLSRIDSMYLVSSSALTNMQDLSWYIIGKLIHFGG